MNYREKAQGIFGEFKTFVLKGNVVDLAVGVVIGTAFGDVVKAAVTFLITPLVGAIGGQPNFSSVHLGPIMIGAFLNALISFVIIAAVVFFFVVKPLNFLMAAAKRKAEEQPAAPTPLPDDVQLLMEIRDLLKQRGGPGAL